MKLNHPLVHKALGIAGALTAKLLRQTIDWRAIYLDPRVDTVHPEFAGRKVFAGWHEYMLMPIMLRGDPRMLGLASRHRDGEVITQTMQHLGWSVARGSSARGGSGALIQMLRDDERLPNLTPDGPRGPRRHFSPGAIFLASKLELPLVCVGYGYDRPWRLNSWDRFAVPRPFSRCRAVFGPPLQVPAKLDRPTLERYRLYFERQLRWLTQQAEAWAESGQTREGELPVLPGRASPEMLAFDGAPAYQWPAALAQEWQALTSAGETAGPSLDVIDESDRALRRRSAG